MRRRPIPHRGFTIVEVITALTIIAIIGLAMTKLILGQARSFQYDNGARRARTAARSAMNILITDLRMTQDQGGVQAIDAVNNRKVTVRVPTLFGFVCSLSASGVNISSVPTDTFQFNHAKYGGYAVRDSVLGTYTYVVASSTDSIRLANGNPCHSGSVNIYADSIHVAGNLGAVWTMSPAPPAITAVGSPVFVWQTVAYEFKTSAIYPGRLGLYRTVSGLSGADTTSDELIAPFKSTARFSYYTQSPYGNRDSVTTTAPGSLNNIRGFQIFLPAESSDTMPTRNTPQSATATTAVFFKNTRFP